MKKSIYLYVVATVISSAFFTGCQDKSNNNSEMKKIEKIEMPAKLNMTEDEIALRDQEKANEKVLELQEKMASEAFVAVLETQNAIQSLTKNKKEEALKQLKSALDKIEVATTRFPELMILPIDINVNRNELITDINSVKLITKEAEKALKNEQIQDAKELLTGLSSEIDITTINIDLAIYPTSIKKAIVLIKSNKLDEAKFVLKSALDDFVIVEKMIPIPVLNAEIMIEEASRLHLEDRNANKTEINNLLSNAEYQLKLAEALGYGKKDHLYKDLFSDIKSLKKAVKSNSELKTLLDNLRTKLIKFRQRIF